MHSRRVGRRIGLVLALVLGAAAVRTPSASAAEAGPFEVPEAWQESAIVVSAGSTGRVAVLAHLEGSGVYFFDRATLSGREVPGADPGSVSRDGLYVARSAGAAIDLVHLRDGGVTSLDLSPVASLGTVERMAVADGGRLVAASLGGGRIAVANSSVVVADAATGATSRVPLDGVVLESMSPSGRYLVLRRSVDCPPGTDPATIDPITCPATDGWIWDTQLARVAHTFRTPPLDATLLFPRAAAAVADNGTYVVAGSSRDSSLQFPDYGKAEFSGDLLRQVDGSFSSPWSVRDTRTGFSSPITFAGRETIGALSADGKVVVASGVGFAGVAFTDVGPLRPPVDINPANAGLETFLYGNGNGVVNVTVVDPDRDGFLTIWPCDQPRPPTSTLNYRKGEIVANTVIDGSGLYLCMYSKANVDVVVDRIGTVGGFEHIAYRRLLDTRDTHGGPLAAGETATVAMGDGVEPTSSAVVVNLTAVDPTDDGYAVVWPCDASTPATSNLNFHAGHTTAGAAVVPLGPSHTLCATSNVSTHLIIDLTGAFVAGAVTGPIGPSRLLDTRTPGAGPAVAGGTNLPVPVDPGQAGTTVVRLTAVNAARPGWVGAGCGGIPATSVTNPADAFPVSNLAFLTAASACAYTSVTTDLVADAQATLTTMAVDPKRLSDSRIDHPPLPERFSF